MIDNHANNAIFSVLTRSIRLPVLLFWGAGFFFGCADKATQHERCEFYTMRGATESEPCVDSADIMTRLEAHDGTMRFECVRRDLYGAGYEIMICEEESDGRAL